MQKRMLAALVAIALLALASGVFFTESAQAQDANATMQARLAMLQNRIQTESGFLVTFEFKTFIADYNALQPVPDARSGSTLTVPFRSPNGEVTITLDEIGNDHLCFDEQHGSELFTRCMMFSEIASVRYRQ